MYKTTKSKSGPAGGRRVWRTAGLADGRLADGRLADGRLADDRLADGRLADGRLADGRLAALDDERIAIDCNPTGFPFPI